MKIRKIKKRYKTMFRTRYCCTKVKFKQIGISIETEPHQYSKLHGIFVVYEVRKWYHKKELTTQYVRIRFGACETQF